MNKTEVAKLLGVIALQYPTSGVSNSNGTVEAWLKTLAEFEPGCIWQAFEDVASQSGDFPPNVRQIANSAKLTLFPLLALNPMEHKLQNTLFFRIYCIWYSYPPVHNVRGNADDLDKWMNKYASHMNESLAKMKAASCERIAKYIFQMSVNLEKYDKKKLEDHSEVESEKPISPTFIADFKKNCGDLLAYIASGPHEPTEETKARWATNLRDYSSKVMRRTDGQRPTQTFSLEVPTDDPAHGKIYTCKRTRHLKGDRVKEPRTGIMRLYLD